MRGAIRTPPSCSGPPRQPHDLVFGYDSGSAGPLATGLGSFCPDDADLTRPFGITKRRASLAFYRATRFTRGRGPSTNEPHDCAHASDAVAADRHVRDGRLRLLHTYVCNGVSSPASNRRATNAVSLACRLPPLADSLPASTRLTGRTETGASGPLGRYLCFRNLIVHLPIQNYWLCLII